MIIRLTLLTVCLLQASTCISERVIDPRFVFTPKQSSWQASCSTAHFEYRIQTESHGSYWRIYAGNKQIGAVGDDENIPTAAIGRSDPYTSLNWAVWSKSLNTNAEIVKDASIHILFGCGSYGDWLPMITLTIVSVTPSRNVFMSFSLQTLNNIFERLVSH